MEISLDKNAFVITGDEDRYNLFVKIFNKYNLPIPKRFNACRSYIDRGITGCTHSHYSIYKIAETYDLPYVIVFEDDAFPRENIVEYFKNAVDNAPEDWKFLKIEDVFFNKYIDKRPYNDYWFSGKMPIRGSGSAAYIVSANGYKKIINEIEKFQFNKKFPIDLIFQYTLMHKRDGYYISNVPMFLQHNLHNKKLIHPKSNFKNDSKIVLGDPDDMKNFKIESWL